MKKKLLTGLLVLAMMFGIAGCGQTEEGGGGSDTEGEEKKTEITWAVMNVTNENEVKAYDTVVENYNRENGKGYTVTLSYIESTDDAQYNTWLSSQLMGGVAPDIVESWYSPAVENYRKGLVRDLSDILEEPNPYEGSGNPWKDNFTDGLLNQSMDNQSNAIPSIPLSTVAVKVFYNKDVFEQAGITEEPETFADFMEVCGTLAKNDIVPFIVPNKSAADNVFNWLHRMFMDQMIDGIVYDMDISGNAQIEMNEICAAYDKGMIDLTQEPWNEPLNIIKDFSQYWYPGYNGIDTSSAQDLFLRQEGAMLMSLGGSLKNFLENPDLEFEIGYFTFPYLTKETSPLACEVAYEMGGAPQDSQCIPNSTEGDKLEAAIDFLQYLSSPKAAAVMTEYAWTIPPFKEVEGLPENMANMYIEGKTSVLRLLAPQTDELLYQDDTKLGQLFLDDQISAQEFSEALQKDLAETVEQQKTTNGWSEENNWGFDAGE